MHESKAKAQTGTTTPLQFIILVNTTLYHAVDKLADERLAVAVLPALNEGDALLGKSTRGGVQLEGPQELGNLAEVLPAGKQLVNHIFGADHILAAQLFLNDGVIGYGDALLLHAGKAALVH